MNKKLIKRVAVASLAALMTIPNLTIIPGNSTNIVYAIDSVSMYEKTLKNYEQQLKNYESYGNTKMVEKTKERIAQTKQQLENAKQKEVVKTQKAAQAQALQAEKDRIANTVYPLTARYVKDFVPAVDDGKPHFYERPDLPGVIFTLEKDSLGIVRDLKPNVEITEGEDFHRDSTFSGTNKTFDNIYQEIKIAYISPFNFCGVGARVYGSSASDFRPDTERSGNIYLADGWCQWIGKNREVSFTRQYYKAYKQGWPDHYVGKSTNELPDGYFYDPNLRKVPLEEIKSHLQVEFSTQEKMKARNTAFNKFNTEHGNSWVHEQDIYSVAREHGTDYTDEERQQLSLK